VNNSEEYVEYADDEEPTDLRDLYSDEKLKSASTLKAKSPFMSAFNDAVLSLQHESDTEGEPNNSYCPAAFKVFSDIIHLYLLWSAILQGNVVRFACDLEINVQPTNISCKSNTVVESHFKGMKHGRLDGKLRVRPAEFADFELKYVLGKLNERDLPAHAARKKIEPRVNVIDTHILRMDIYFVGSLPLGACQVDLTVEHILLHCVSFTNARDNCFCLTLTSMSELFSKIASRSIINFIKETGFYRKI